MNKQMLRRAAPVLLLPAVLSACLGTQSVNDPNSPLALLERRVSENERRVNNAATSSSNVDLLAQVQRLEAEVRDLRGEVEQQRFQLDRSEKRQRDLYRDLDRRISSGAGSAAQPSYGQPAQPVPNGGVQATPPPADERGAYRAAFDSLKNGQYQNAIGGFKGFLASYPNSEYTANAQYWLGESYYVTKAWPAARTEFQKVLDKHPNSAKAPDAQLKLGYVYYELGRWDAAKQTLSQVVNRYPGTTIANLAQQRLDLMRQEGR